MNGYFTLPYQYLLETNLSDDFWTVRLVASPAGKAGAKKAARKTRK
jgi:hypothetical protein